MKLQTPFRKARREDCLRIAELFNVAGAGVPEYVWTSMAGDFPGLSPLEIGEQRYAREDILFSYRNTVVAEIDGEVVGILVAFPIEVEDEVPDSGSSEPAAEVGADRDEPDIMAPFHELEVPGSYYVCAVALLPEYRNRGLGTRFMDIARQAACDGGFTTLSLIAFEQNPKAVKLYEKLGFRTVDSRPLIPHPLIRYTGKALLMAADV